MWKGECEKEREIEEPRRRGRWCATFRVLIKNSIARLSFWFANNRELRFVAFTILLAVFKMGGRIRKSLLLVVRMTLGWRLGSIRNYSCVTYSTHLFILTTSKMYIKIAIELPILETVCTLMERTRDYSFHHAYFTINRDQEHSFMIV